MTPNAALAWPTTAASGRLTALPQSWTTWSSLPGQRMFWDSKSPWPMMSGRWPAASRARVRQTEITDSLVDLLIQLVLKINTRAERKAEKELGAELKKVRGKEAMLLRVAETARSEPSGMVRRVIFPVVGGEKTSRPWRRRPRRTRPATKPGSARCGGRRTRRTGGGCSRHC